MSLISVFLYSDSVKYEFWGVNVSFQWKNTTISQAGGFYLDLGNSRLGGEMFSAEASFCRCFLLLCHISCSFHRTVTHDQGANGHQRKQQLGD